MNGSPWKRTLRAGSALERGLLWLRSQLTPGQRWTSGLTLLLAMVVALFGTPSGVTGSQAAGATTGAEPVAGPNSPGPPNSSTPDPTTLGGTTAEQSGPDPSRAGGFVAPPGTHTPDSGSTAGPPSGIAAPLPNTLIIDPRIVAVVSPTPDAAPGRDEQAIAEALLSANGIKAPIVVDDGSPAQCSSILEQGTVVLGGRTLRLSLRDCLLSRGATVLAYDGSAPPAIATGALLSTRRSFVDTLIDLARWGAQAGKLHGKVGLVVSDEARVQTAPVLAAYRERGVDVAAVAYIGTGPNQSTDTSSEVRRFASLGVQSVIFAVPVAVQARWVGQAAVLAPATQYVVSDAYDGGVNEGYPATFDGSRAIVSVRGPWSLRAEGTTAEQRDCQTDWAQRATPAATLPTDDLDTIYAWCLNGEVVSTALRSTPAALSTALRLVTHASGLTSDVGPLPRNGYGPFADATLQWRASCNCWEPLTGFTPREAAAPSAREIAPD